MDEIRSHSKSLDHDDTSLRHGGLKMVKKQIFRKAHSAHNFLDGAPLSQIMTDEKGVVEYVSPDFLDFTGYQEGEMVGHNCNILQGKQTDMQDVMDLRNAIRRHKQTSVVILNYCKNGNPFWNILTITPHFSPNGVCDAYTGEVIHIEIPESLRMQPKLCVDDALALISVYASVPRGFETMPMASITMPANSKIFEEQETPVTESQKSQPSMIYRHQNYAKKFENCINETDAHHVVGHHTFVAETALPTARGRYRMRAYRNDVTGAEPLAMIYGDIEGKENVVMRVHDQCVTSEVFGSLKCDCKEQLDYSLEYIKGHVDGGMVLYLPQEGRGIGLANKVAAYAAQENGLDTVDANRVLGLPDDARTYESVRDILDDLNIKSVRLMTNNPRKIERLSELGIRVVERVECVVVPNSTYSMGYVQAKAARMGHMIDTSSFNNGK